MATRNIVSEALGIAMAEFQKYSGSSDDKDFNKQSEELRKAVSGEHGREDLGNAILETLDCVYEVAKIAASAASTVWPAASACVSGLAYLLKTVKAYRYLRLANIRDIIGSLRKRLNFVKRQSVKTSRNGISSELDVQLLSIICNFLHICAIYAKIKKRRTSRNPISLIPLFARAAIGSDYGIAKRLCKIEDSTQEARFLQIEDASEAISSSQSTQVQERNRQFIIDSLQCQEHGFWKPWVDSAFDNYRQNFVPEAAQWLQEHQVFRDWSSREKNTRTSILAIQSPTDGSGKSSLCSAAIARLRDPHFTASWQEMPAVCYYFFNPIAETKPISNKRKSTGLNATQLLDAVRSIVWQFSQISESYQGFLAEKCRSGSKSLEAEEMWQQWLSAYNPQNGSASIFIVLDGIDQIKFDSPSMEDKARTALRKIIKEVTESGKGKLDIRLLLSFTGDEEYISTRVPKKTERKSISYIDLKDFGDSMVEKFIEKKLEWMCDRFVSDQDTQMQWRQKNKNRLLQHANNNIGMVSALFNDIGHHEPSEFSGLLDEYLKNYVNGISDHIQTLESTLEDDQINDLNEIIACIVLMQQWPTLSQIQDILALRRGTKWRQNKEALKQQLRCYGRLLRVSGDIVSSWDTMNFFLEREALGPNVPIPAWLFQQESMGSITDAGPPPDQYVVHESEISIVKQVLLLICGNDLYERLALDSFFDSVRQRQNTGGLSLATINNSETGLINLGMTAVPRSRPGIKFEISNGHIRIARFLLKSLQDPRKATRGLLYESLHNYAISYLCWHLSEIGPSPNTGSLRPILEMLLSLFTEPYSIKLWLGHAWSSKHDFEHWLESVVNKTIDWAKRIDTSRAIDQDLLLKKPIEILATQWLQDSGSGTHIGVTFERLASCYKKAGKLQSEVCAGELVNEVKHLVVADGTWPKDTSSVSNVADVRIIETLLYYEDHLQVLEHSEFLLKKGDAHWRVSWYYAQALVKEAKFNHAQEILTTLKKKKLDHDFLQKHPEEMKNILQLRWECFLCMPDREADDFEIACYELLRYFPDHYSTIDALRNGMNMEEKVEFYRHLSRRYLPQTDGSPAMTTMSGLLRNHAERLEFHQELIECFRKRPHILKDIYTDAIEAIGKKDAVWYKLRFYSALALHYHYPQKEGNLRMPKRRYHIFKWLLEPSKRTRESESLKIWEEDVIAFLALQLPRPSREDAEDYDRIRCTVTEYTVGMLASSYTSIPLGEESSVQEHVKLLVQIRERDAPTTASGDRANRFLDHSLARLHHLHGERKESRQLVSTSIASGIMLLTDSVPHNDWQGCMVLIEALKAVDDDLNALTACGLLYKLIVDEEAPVRSSFFCDGNCFRSWPADISSIYMCKDCADVQFGSCCYSNHVEASGSNLICGDMHKFLEFSEEAAKDMENTEKGMVRHGGKEMTQQTWIDLLREQYLDLDLEGPFLVT